MFRHFLISRCSNCILMWSYFELFTWSLPVRQIKSFLLPKNDLIIARIILRNHKHTFPRVQLFFTSLKITKQASLMHGLLLSCLHYAVCFVKKV